jgi:microcystin-dependent protein|tara:strand:- start:138 stop:725 length:588 start_codon:yes stop_codon:yes gene_type:complete
MANYEATRYDFDGQNLTGIQGLNTGLIIPWTDSSVPTGFLECNGAAVSRSTYADLFAVIGTTYGAGNGSTTFTLPDLQDDVTVSKSGSKNLASTGGANTVASSGNIGGNSGSHTVIESEMPSHSHPTTGAKNSPPTSVQANIPGGAVNSNHTQPAAVYGNSPGGSSHSHTISANFSGDATSVLQPYLTLLYIIKT